MADTGQDVLDVGSAKVGQKYVFGARVPLDNPAWKGPWDCAEFATWCAYQAYGIIFGASPKKLATAEPYSGFWYDDARKFGTVITWQEALKIPGAAVIRRPTKSKIGHVAFSLGDNDRTLEARGAAFGVGIFKGAKGRAWSIGCLLPGVDYGDTAPGPGPTPAPAPAPAEMPAGYLWLKQPNLKGGAVAALQKALAAAGIDPGPVDGEFGPMTERAVLSLQIVKGLEVDGIVGPATAGALGLAFPIKPTAADEAELNKPELGGVDLPPSPAAVDLVVDIKKKGKSYQATTAAGHAFLIGKPVSYTDDMTRLGLYQDTAEIKDSLQFGVYAAADFTGAFGQWAHFIGPTLTAEGNARFATLNSYDRAAFTFGAPQLAAHTPRKNFVIYLRRLLALPNAALHFPELEIRANAGGDRTIHLVKGSTATDLEAEILVTRPNGKKEVQLARLMKYLNSSPTAVDADELTAAARLMNWLRLDPAAKELQIAVFIDQAKDQLKTAKSKVGGFDGKDWRIALWIMDILHQGRGTYKEMTAALKASDPEAGLMKIGAIKYKTRIKTVAAGVKTLAASNLMNGFTV